MSTRMLLITGAELISDHRLHQMIYRYTGSARETRVIVRRIRRAMRRGRIQSCMIQSTSPHSPTPGARWQVLVSYLDVPPLREAHG